MARDIDILDAIGQQLCKQVALDYSLPVYLQRLIDQLAAAEPVAPPWEMQSGGCLCGDVRFQLKSPPYEIDYCHCASCRKHTGAPVSVFADCKAEAFELIKGQYALYESSPGVKRGFCPRCGSTMTYEVEGEIHVHIGALDRPEDFPPPGHASFADERLPWFRLKRD